MRDSPSSMYRQPSRGAPIPAIVQHEHTERRPAAHRRQTSTSHSTPHDKLLWQTPCDLVHVETADDVFRSQGIADYAFIPADQGGMLGQGKFSAVYLATKGDKKYAVKHTPLHPHHEQIATRLLREAHILAQLPQHTNLIKAYETIRTPGHFYLVEEYLEGYINLETHILAQPGRTIPCEAALHILDQLVSVCRSALHSPIHVAHRDIKPENVLYHPETGHVVILDLGLSTHFSASEPKLTTVCGSPAYWSPELWLSNQRQRASSPDIVRYWGPEVDIWCIAVTVLRLVGGKRFPLGTSFASIEDIEDKVRARLAAVSSEALRERIASLLDLDADRRMAAFKTFEVSQAADEAPTTEYEFKSTSFIPGEPTHALAIPLLDPDLPPISRLSSRTRSPSRSRRSSPSRHRLPSRPTSRPVSRANSPTRVASFDSLTLLGQGDFEPMPPAPLLLSFGNPEHYSTKRALSFFKYALRCAGILYRVVDPPLESDYALLLSCVITLRSSPSTAQHTLNGVLRPTLLRAASAGPRSASTPPPKKNEAPVKPKVHCLPFTLGISSRFHPVSPVSPFFSTLSLDPDVPDRERRRRKAKSRSRASSPGAPSGFAVHVSDPRALEITREALSVGTPEVEETEERETSEERRGRQARGEAVNALGLREAQDPLMSPAVERPGFFSRWTGSAARSRSMVHLAEAVE